jgi:predicted MFS family arabinose efflux permease
MLNDNFTLDGSLNSNVWQKNGASGTVIFEAWQNAEIGLGGPYCTLEDPNPTFSTSGMSISSANTPYTMTTIESTGAFYAPFTLQASVSATQGGATPFCMWLRNYELPGVRGFSGVLNANAPNYGIWTDGHGQFWVKRLLDSPTLNTIYQLTITVSAVGEISLSLSAEGQNLGSVLETSIGTGPFKIILGQYEMSSDTTGIGPNQAIWKSVTLSSNLSNVTSSPTPPSTNSPPSTPNSTHGTSCIPSSATTTSPTSIQTPPSSPIGSESPSATPSFLPTQSPLTSSSASTIPSSSSSIDVSPLPSNEQGAATFKLPLEMVFLLLALSSLILLLFIYRLRKRDRAVTVTLEANIPPSKWLLAGLLAATFSVTIIDVIVPLLRPEIARSFGISTSTTFQLSAFNAITAVVTGLTLSALSIKIKYKSLMLSGVLCIVVCSIGVFFAPTFLFAQVFYTFNGIGSVIVGAMSSTLVGELYPDDKKARILSLIFFVGYIAALVGNPIAGYVAEVSGAANWRNTLLWFILPVTVVCFLMVLFFIPRKTLPTIVAEKQRRIFSGFREVFTNKSTVACLASGFFGAALFSVTSFDGSFTAEVFGMTPFLRSFLPVAAILLLIIGAFIGGAIVNRVGRKCLLVASGLPSAIFTIFGYAITLLVPNVWAYLGFRLVAALFGGMTLLAVPLLLMEQLPKYRGTVLSLHSALHGIGGASSFFVGAAILDFYSNPKIGYPIAILLLGGLGIVSALVVLFFVNDPIKKTVYQLKAPA